MFKRKVDSEHISSISDLMSGLMMVFLLIAISYMLNVSQSQQRIKQIAVTYEQVQAELYTELLKEFSKDLPKWKATINKEDLSIKFYEPEILFAVGESTLTPKFKEILDDFFPRYLKILSSDKFRDNIDEIRIEGHTSSEWNASQDRDKDEAYFKNMQLSQERTRTVLKYCYMQIRDETAKEFMKKYVTANGLSSSKTVIGTDGAEDFKASRRVEFRTKTNAETRIATIIEEFNK